MFQYQFIGMPDGKFRGYGVAIIVLYSSLLQTMEKFPSIFSSPVHDRLYRYARTLLSDSEEAMDTVHDVLERLWRRHTGENGIENPEAFALRSVRNSCIDRLRTRKETTDAIPDTGQGPWAEHWSDIQLVRMAIGRLPEKQRTVIHLKDIEGFTTAEIAGIMGTGENQVRAILSRARKALKEIIIEETGL